MPNKENKVFIIVEDSFDCAKRHKQHLEQLGVDVVILRSLANFEEAAPKLIRARKISGVITDGLHGDWQGVVNKARELGMENVWVVSGNEKFRKLSHYYPGTRSASKNQLNNDPSKYKEITK